MDGVGFEFIVTLTEDESAQPLPLVSTTFNEPEPADPHLTTTEFVLEPELMEPPLIYHAYVSPLLFLVESFIVVFTQTLVAPIREGAGLGFTVIFTESFAEHPLAVMVCVNVYVVVVVGLTLGLLLVEVYPEGLLVQL